MLTPIQQTMGAIEEGSLDDFQKLLKLHPDLIADYGPELIERAAACNRVDLLPILVAMGVSVNAVSLEITPLKRAAIVGALDAAMWLIDHGAEIDGRTSSWQSTPLHDAIRRGHIKLVTYLLERGADPNAFSANPARNALAIAQFWQKVDIAELLESRGLTAVVVEPKPVDVEAPEFAMTTASDPVQWFDAKWWHTYDYCERHGFAAMSTRNKVLFLVGYLIDQWRDGGIAGVYFNPSGKYAREMSIALEKIGTKRGAQLMRDLNSLFAGGAPAVDDSVRESQIRKLPGTASPLVAQLQQVMDEMHSSRGAPTILCQLYDYYVRPPASR